MNDRVVMTEDWLHFDDGIVSNLVVILPHDSPFNQSSYREMRRIGRVRAKPQIGKYEELPA